MRRLLRFGALAAAVVAAGTYPAAFAADRLAGTDAVPMTKLADEATIELQRASFDDSLTGEARRTAVVEIYGAAGAHPAPERFLFIAEDRLVRPPEDTSLVLLRPGDGHDVQAKSLYFAAPRIAAGALVAAVVAWLLARRGPAVSR